MKKCVDTKTIIITILILFLAVVVIYGIYNGSFSKPTILYVTNQTSVIEKTVIITNQTNTVQDNNAPLNPEKEYYKYNVNLLITSERICVGEYATGSITSNIKNGICTVFINSGTGFKVYKNVLLNAIGYYSETNQMNTAGTIIFRAVCCDLSRNCRISNDDSLSIEICDNDNDGVPDDQDPDDDNDGWPDNEEIEHGTDPLNPNDYPGHETGCNSFCLGLGYIRGDGPVDSVGNCESFEVGKYLSGNSGKVCCCKDCGLWCKSSGWTYGTVTTKANCNNYPTNYYDNDLGCCCHMENNTQQQTRLHTQETCQQFSAEEMGVGDFYGNSLSQGGISWTSETCSAYATAVCKAYQPPRSLGSYAFDINCCVWYCKEIRSNDCNAVCANVTGSGSGSILFSSIPSGYSCYGGDTTDYPSTQCPNGVHDIGSTENCCCWKCN